MDRAKIVNQPVNRLTEWSALSFALPCNMSVRIRTKARCTPPYKNSMIAEVGCAVRRRMWRERLTLTLTVVICARKVRKMREAESLQTMHIRKWSSRTRGYCRRAHTRTNASKHLHPKARGCFAITSSGITQALARSRSLTMTVVVVAVTLSFALSFACVRMSATMDDNDTILAHLTFSVVVVATVIVVTAAFSFSFAYPRVSLSSGRTTTACHSPFPSSSLYPFPLPLP